MGFLLLVPFFLVRFGLLALLDSSGIKRAAHFAPMDKREAPAYVAYQLSNLCIIACLCFLRVKLLPPALLYAGAAVYSIGIVLLVLSVVGFTAPAKNGINTKRVYRFSRNPMYVAYFVVFAGCILLTHSLLLLGFLLVFQVSSHWIILAEERWCLEQFGEEYRQYMQKVRRYI